MAVYRVYSDDFAYVSASRDLGRTITNLFMPHNTHIVPAWRVVTWFLVACAGSLERVPDVLAVASYGILAATMMLVGRFAARETGSEVVGAAAAVATGTTSLMLAPATWYSAGQPLWASFAAVAALWYAQEWRRSRSRPALALCMASTACAGWFWTIGHLAGPSAALYLWLDGRRSRRAAAAPIAATVLAVGLALGLGAGKVDSRVSFHGRTAAEAARPVEGLFHTMQAIPESLVLGNLGLAVETTAGQGALLTIGLVGLWAASRLRRGGFRTCNPMEIAGAAFLVGSYLVEWTVRGYLDYRYLRTINVDMIVPWYHVAPQVGAVLFAAGWWSGPRTAESSRRLSRPPVGLSRASAMGVLAFAAVLVALNRPRVEDLWFNSAPPLTATEQARFPIPELQRMRTNAVMMDEAEHQRRHLRRFDLAEKTALSMGIGLDAVRAAIGRVDAPELPDAYDAVDLLDLPEKGKAVDPDQVRQALARYLFLEPPPRPAWLDPGETWPPPKRGQMPGVSPGSTSERPKR
ncbi:hypothetical protein [Planctomyces sp. SH-PL62]|uniref:hypothetical protein n=1 Tax=Planctomyces sp. SH-PL62 TaxID=1636152 RepID=UPI00078CA8B2|nr:hypothetical protein [Planctomyces sp. SH-PL62]AMV36594.1 hypothetical protein VT85_04120 [Planctomyces sp. SH-PL62]